MPDGGFGGVVRRLRLRHVDNGAGHGADHDHRAFDLALHEMPRHFAGEKVRAVDIDAPELLHAVWWVCDGVEVFGEAGRCDEVVDFAVVSDYIGHNVLDRHVVRHVTVVRGDFRNAALVSVL